MRVDATVRADAGTIALDASAAAEASLRRLEVACAIERPGGWLVGDAGAPPDGAVRVRRAELVATVAPSATGGTGVTADLRLHEAAVASPTVPLLRLGDPLLAAALQGLADALAAEAGPAAGLVVDALAALGLVGGGADPAAALPALAPSRSGISAPGARRCSTPWRRSSGWRAGREGRGRSRSTTRPWRSRSPPRPGASRSGRPDP